MQNLCILWISNLTYKMMHYKNSEVIIKFIAYQKNSHIKDRTENKIHREKEKLQAQTAKTAKLT